MDNETIDTKDRRWYEDASYSYEMVPKGKQSSITFIFPNAASSSLEFTDWLYRFGDDGKIIDTNMTAEVLMCYVDMIPND